jgi:hypothetical protein
MHTVIPHAKPARRRAHPAAADAESVRRGVEPATVDARPVSRRAEAVAGYAGWLAGDVEVVCHPFETAPSEMELVRNGTELVCRDRMQP